MIQPQTIVRIADNSGGKIARVFKILGGTRRRYASIGDQVIAAVQVADPFHMRKQVKKKSVVRGVVVRQRNAYRRVDGSYVRFDENAIVIIDSEKKEPKGTRIFGPIPRELGEAGYKKIVSLAPEVV